MVEYIYENITTQPNLQTIRSEINSSLMENKDFQRMGWEEDSAKLTITFLVSLSVGDKTILDNIIGSL